LFNGFLENDKFINSHDYIITVMRPADSGYENEFQDLVGDLTKAFNIDGESVALASMLYNIAQEKKSTNLIVRDINGKFDQILHRIEKLEGQIKDVEHSKTQQPELTLRDQQILDFVEKQGEVCAETVKKEFNYKGANAASSRLNKLYKEGLLHKTHKVGKVYYSLNQA
jgi:hypothetical protein